MDKDLQRFADMGKELLKKDGHWDSGLASLEERNKTSTSYKWLMVAILILSAAAIGFFMYKSQNKMEPVPIAYFEAIPTSLVPNVRDGNDDNKTDLQKAVMAYGAQNYVQAEVLLKPLVAEDSDFARLYLASTYIALDKNEEALNLLNALSSDQFQDYVEWNRAIALLKIDRKRAEKQLKDIAGNTDHFRSKRAKEILEKEF